LVTTKSKAVRTGKGEKLGSPWKRARLHHVLPGLMARSPQRTFFQISESRRETVKAIVQYKEPTTSRDNLYSVSGDAGGLSKEVGGD
jgi:hypothetical protein